MSEYFRSQLSRLPRGLRTRFAPSPTGYLHLGHVASALFVWGIAQARDATVLLRIEDHDVGRCRPEFAAALLDDLEWLGCISTSDSISVQSRHPTRYAEALKLLRQSAEIYACRCSRKILAARIGMEHEGEELRYDSYCRLHPGPAAQAGLRLFLPPAPQLFDDLLQGPQRQIPAAQCGDLLLQERSGQWTYNFCVSVDDTTEEIDLVIRGLDLLHATGRQLQLAALLGKVPPHFYLHHPLICDENGQKLSKRYGSTALHSLREKGHSPADVFGLAAHAVGLLEREQALSFKDLGGLFS